MLERGKKIYPKKSPITSNRDEVRGRTWALFKNNGDYIFEYLSGSHGGGTKRHVVSKEDFERVKAGEITDYDLMLKYDLS